jgi:predicted double-glycine peptidase
MVYFQQCIFVVIDISADDVLLHDDWFQQYEVLKAKQKKAIQEWRISKNKNSQKNSSGKSDPLEQQQRNKGKYHVGSAEKKQKIEEWKVIYLIQCLSKDIKNLISQYLESYEF